MAVGVGSMRGSAVNRLRPVGSTSRRPRAGAPAGPGATRRPSRAASNAARSAAALTRHCAGTSPDWGARPKTCSPSLMARSLRSHSQASMRRSASPSSMLLSTPGIACDAGALRRFDDEARKSVAPLAIETVSLSVLVHEPLEFACTCGERRRDERRRQMSDRHRRRCAAWPAPPRPDC